MSRTWDHEIQLVAVNNEINDNGFEETKLDYGNKILSNRLNVHSVEFWAAKQNVIDLKYVFEIHGIEYNGERAVKYKDNLYKVERTYLNKDNYLEITLSDWSDEHGSRD